MKVEPSEDIVPLDVIEVSPIGGELAQQIQTWAHENDTTVQEGVLALIARGLDRRTLNRPPLPYSEIRAMVDAELSLLSPPSQPKRPWWRLR